MMQSSQASTSRLAQEKLAELEKASAPFHDQLAEAAKFIGVDLEALGRVTNGDFEERPEGLSHGREEWLLRWLLKKLQSQDNIARFVL